MDTISTSFICLYGTTGSAFLSAATPGDPRDYMNKQVENAGIEPATTTCVLTTFHPHLNFCFIWWIDENTVIKCLKNPAFQGDPRLFCDSSAHSTLDFFDIAAVEVILITLFKFRLFSIAKLSLSATVAVTVIFVSHFFAFV